jgi:DNA topoisomerase-1
LTISPDSECYEIELEFLGKDSMQYKQTICFGQYGDLGKQVYRCLKSFCAGKKPDQQVFDTLEPSRLNAHLTSLMKGLTAKVFRTFNASVTLEKELPTAESLEGLSVQDKVARYNAANRQVAILCNHQKTVSKAAETQLENLGDKLSTLRAQRQQLVDWRDLVSKGKGGKVPLKEDDAATVEVIKAQLEAAKAQRAQAKTNEEKLNATAAMDEATKAAKDDQARRFKESHMYKKTPTAESLSTRIDKFAEQIRKLEIDVRDRDENKEVALGTSKTNYMDPRISVAWCKRCEVPIDKIFPRTLRDKFNWAMCAPPEWKFE